MYILEQGATIGLGNENDVIIRECSGQGNSNKGHVNAVLGFLDYLVGFYVLEYFGVMYEGEIFSSGT